MKILFINVKGDNDSYWGYYPPLGLLSVSTYILHQKIIDRKNLMILDANFPHFLKHIEYFKPDIIGFSYFSLHRQKTIQLANKIDSLYRAFLIVGGPHISLNPTDLPKPFQLGVIGEGENTMLEILKIFPQYQEKKQIKIFKKISGITLREKNQKIYLTPKKEPLQSLDIIPTLDYSLLPKVFFRKEIVHENGTWKSLNVMPIFTSRGCPYNCVFCARHYIGKGIRFFSPDHVAQEIQSLIKKHHIQAIHIWDDNFVISKERLEIIADALEKKDILKKVIFYRIFARTDLFRKKGIVDVLKKLHVSSVSFGFESNSQNILKFLKKDTTTPLDNKKALQLCNVNKFGIVANLIVGSPNEKPKDLKKTYDFAQCLARNSCVEWLEVNRLTPLPGTEIWDYGKLKNLIHKENKFDTLPYTDQQNKYPLLMVDPISIKYFIKYWPKFKILENKVELKNKKTASWLSAYTIMQKNKKNRENSITFDLIIKDISEKRYLLAYKLLLFFSIKKLIHIKTKYF